MGEQEFIFNVMEMGMVAVTCSGCLNGITFNAGNGDTGLPTKCPVCNGDFRQVGELLGKYREFFKGVNAQNNTFQFRVRSKV